MTRSIPIRVENVFDGQYKSDEVDVKVEKGTVTVVASGDQSYFLGQEVLLSGTNSESDMSISSSPARTFPLTADY